MPLLLIRLKFDGTTKEKSVLEIPFNSPVIKLKGYQIYWTTPATVDSLFVSLNFLDNHKNIITNTSTIFGGKQIIPLYNDREKVSTAGKENIIFYLSGVLKPIREWFVFDKDGNEYTSQSYTIDLVFTYK